MNNHDGMPEGTIYTIEKLAEKLGRSKKTISNWCYNGDIPKKFQYRLGGKGQPFFVWEEIRHLFKRGEPLSLEQVEIQTDHLYSLTAVARMLRMTIAGVQDYVAKGFLRFIPGSDGSKQFLGRQLLADLDNVAQTILKPAGDALAGAQARGEEETEDSPQRHRETKK